MLVKALIWYSELTNFAVARWTVLAELAARSLAGTLCPLVYGWVLQVALDMDREKMSPVRWWVAQVSRRSCFLMLCGPSSISASDLPSSIGESVYTHYRSVVRVAKSLLEHRRTVNVMLLYLHSSYPFTEYATRVTHAKTWKDLCGRLNCKAQLCCAGNMAAKIRGRLEKYSLFSHGRSSPETPHVTLSVCPRASQALPFS